MSFNPKRVLGICLRELRHDAPTLEAIGGVCLTVAGALILCASADEIAEVNEKVREHKEEIKLADHDENGWDDMGEKRGHYIFRTSGEVALGYIKAAGPGLGVLGCGLVLGGISHANLTSQLEATAASLAAVTCSYNTYRQRVVEDQGAEKDLEYYTGYSTKKEEVVDTETGEITEVTTFQPKSSNDIQSLFSFPFTEETNANWNKSPEVNYNFLSSGVEAVNRALALAPDEQISLNQMFKCFGAPYKKYGQGAGAFKYDKDGNRNTIRLNPVLMQGIIDGITPDCECCLLEYEDGRPLETDILNDPRNKWN